MKVSTYYVPESTFGSRQTKSPQELGGVSKTGRACQMTRSTLGTQKAGRGRSRGPGQGGMGGRGLSGLRQQCRGAGESQGRQEEAGVRAEGRALGAENYSLVLGYKKLILHLSIRPRSSMTQLPQNRHRASSSTGRKGIPK